MKHTLTLVLIAGLAVTAAACTDSRRARNAATWGGSSSTPLPLKRRYVVAEVLRG